jgi:hypothetical protein
LTNLRFRYSDVEWGKAHIVSVMLEKISSIEVRCKSRPFLIILGGLIAGANGDSEIVGVGIIVGVVLCVLYFCLTYLLYSQ